MEVSHPVAAQKNTSHLTVGIGISLALHLVISALVLGTPQGPPAQPSVSFIDLKNVKLPTETAPPAAAPPAPAPVPEEVQPTPAQEVPAPQTLAPAAESAPEQPQEPQVAAPAAAAQEQTAATALGLGMSRGYFSSIGNGESLRDSVRGYYLEMLERVNQRWWLDQGVDKRRVRPIIVNLLIARDGAIVDAKVAASSGDPRYDKAVLAALAAVGPFPPLPAGYHEEFFLAPVRLIPPLDLMSF